MTDTSGVIAAISERRTKTLAAIVRDELERMIITGELKAGERINEQAIAGRLGVSRGPVREATRALEKFGLITAIVNQGVFVRQLSIEEAIELYELRAVVVGYACGCAAERASAKERSTLEDGVRRMDAAIAAEDPGLYYELNMQFHDLLMDASRHKRSQEIYQSLVKESHLFRRRSLMSPSAMRESNSEHREIVEAIRAGDVDAARKAGEAHHFGGKRRWLETLK
jgi:DNA-binding GntR family transcriptional regulator